MPATAITLEVDGREVRLSNPDKVFFPATGATKRDLVEHYLACGPGVLRGVRLRPTNLRRMPDGVEGKAFFQKRVPEKRPDWLQTATVGFPSGRTAVELCPTDLAHVVWAVNLGSVDLHPWPVRRFDVEHPDELRIDLDPQPGVEWAEVVRVAAEVRRVLDDHDLVGFPKTSGSRGIHVYVRIVARLDATGVRRAALALAREVERRLPEVATAAWWKEERGRRVFLDYNQNARDRSMASVWSVRPNATGMVSVPFAWDELDDMDPTAWTLATAAERYAAVGDPSEGIDDEVGSLRSLLALADADEAGGLGDAPWPPSFPKAPGEGPRVQPSRARPDDR